MPSQPNESAREDIANAVQILRLDPSAVEPALARLDAALVKLADAEGLAIGKREHELAMMEDRRMELTTFEASAIRNRQAALAAAGAPPDLERRP